MFVALRYCADCLEGQCYIIQEGPGLRERNQEGCTGQMTCVCLGLAEGFVIKSTKENREKVVPR